jgi:hypothetical protein
MAASLFNTLSKTEIAIHVVLAIIFTIILYVITLVVLNIDSIVVNNSVQVLPKQKTQIINGYAPASYLSSQSFNTINPFTDNFKKVGKSINTRGGAQFTYQFWIKLDDVSSDDMFKDLILIMKGDNRKYNLAKYNKDTNHLINTYDAEYLINCPMIKFGASYRELQVFFNTSKGPIPITDGLKPNITIHMTPEDDISTRRNVLSLLPLNWFLFTFVFEDNYSKENGSENGIKFTFYINDFPYLTNTASHDSFLRNNMLKQNDGNIYILPNLSSKITNGTSPDILKMANINYFNYALESKDIARTYQSGPPTYSAVSVTSNEKKPGFLGSYNKIDIYNY